MIFWFLLYFCFHFSPSQDTFNVIRSFKFISKFTLTLQFPHNSCDSLLACTMCISIQVCARGKLCLVLSLSQCLHSLGRRQTQNAKVCVWLCLCCLLMYLFVCMCTHVCESKGGLCHRCSHLFCEHLKAVLIAAPSSLCSVPVANPANNISCVCVCVCYCFSLRCH